MAYDYDVLVLGGGPGGYEAAIRCAQYGLHTALVEAADLGGTCLNRGCIPTKALLHGAEVYETVQSAGTFGIETAALKIDYKRLADFKDTQVKKLRRGIAALEKAHGVTVVKGFGVLKDAHTVLVSDTAITCDKIILATGSAPARPPIPGMDGARVLTSDETLALDILPESLVIIGGGVIGIEFATLFSTLGASVHVLEMMPDILPGVDPEINRATRRVLSGKNVKITCGAKVLSLGDAGGSVSVQYEKDGEKASAEGAYAVVCVGRRPQTERIGLSEAGVKTERGYVLVNDQMETSVPGIYAVGDITGKIQLAHVASAQGLVAAANCAGKAERMRYDIVPACIYTAPEIAYIGLNEQAARANRRDVRVGSFMVAGNGRSAVMNESAGLCRVVTDARNGEILGAQIMAPRATDMIAEIAAVMRCEGTVEELSQTIHPHPTVSEIIMEAAHDVEGLCCHAFPKATG